ncbi:MAG: IclR family transcriptional regulator [Clostridia bacterium]|nr:IclR family transcriptional regulator [Clostridia bacterium]
MPSEQRPVRAVERALDILECFTNTTDLTLMEIAERIDLPASTVYRLVSTLAERGYLMRDGATNRYSLGPSVALLGSKSFKHLDVRKVALPVMKDLVAKTGESVSLYMAIGGKRVCVERVNSPLRLRRVVEVGEQLPLTRGAAGKVLLAYLNDSVRSQVESTEGYTVDRGELERIREKGYAVSHGEREEGVSAVAAPVFDTTGSAVAALSMSGPSFRYTEERVGAYVRAIIEGAEAVSRSLGFRN